jgi:hypothetical protein
MSLVRVYAAETDAELAVALSLLDAYGIPYVSANATSSFNPQNIAIPPVKDRSILVPESAATDAIELLKTLRSTGNAVQDVDHGS